MSRVDCKTWLPRCIPSKDNKSKTIKVHRLVARAFIPNLENKPQVNHKDGNKTNYAIDNLEWCTSQENIRHAHDLGLTVHARGYQAKDSKLTKEQRLNVVLDYALHEDSQKAIAKKFNVSQTAISLVIREYLRTHLIDAGLAIKKSQ